jgi:Flp pilus assembly protein TadG
MQRRNGGRGQALVEFALVIPIFLLLLFGLIDIGHYVYVNNALDQGSREAARVGSVMGFTQDCAGVTSRTQCIQQVALGRMAAAPLTTVSSNCNHLTGNGVVSVAADSCSPGDTLVVTLTTPFSMFTPVIAQLLGQTTLTGKATVTVNN